MSGIQILKVTNIQLSIGNVQSRSQSDIPRNLHRAYPALFTAMRYDEKALAVKDVKANDSKRLQAHLDSFK
jgi:hypothetical protein